MQKLIQRKSIIYDDMLSLCRTYNPYEYEPFIRQAPIVTSWSISWSPSVVKKVYLRVGLPLSTFENETLSAAVYERSKLYKHLL